MVMIAIYFELMFYKTYFVFKKRGHYSTIKLNIMLARQPRVSLGCVCNQSGVKIISQRLKKGDLFPLGICVHFNVLSAPTTGILPHNWRVLIYSNLKGVTPSKLHNSNDPASIMLVLVKKFSTLWGVQKELQQPFYASKL